jgi:hypothetical protein
MQTEDLGHMSRHQVRRREERLRERAIRISREVKRAQADGVPLPYISRDTGIDMSYEHEEWRRWASLAIEMKKADAEFVCDLGVERVGYWQAALDPEQLRAPPPLSAFQPVEPLVRVEAPAVRRFQPQPPPASI